MKYTEESILEVGSEMIRDLELRMRTIFDEAEQAKQQIYEKYNYRHLQEKLEKLRRDITLARCPLVIGQKLRTIKAYYEICHIEQMDSVYSSEDYYLGDARTFNIWAYSLSNDGQKRKDKYNGNIVRCFKLKEAEKYLQK